MPINPDLLIAAAMLQDSLVDKDGTPMSAGIITCYQDNSRTTLKNWYYQSSNFADASGKYTFSPLPNPLTLSAAGTICDINGVDTIPFFYPYSEIDQTQAQPYYITIWNHDRTNQITRPNFPYNPEENNPDEEGSVNNYIINNVLWRNIGTVDLTNILQLTVAPSQHDGFRYPDIQFLKNVTGGQDTVTFTKFPLTSAPILKGDITPEYYINHTCSNSPTGETQKCYQFPISLHVNTLNGVQFTATIQAQNAGGISPGQNTINLFIFQDTGSGTSPPSPILIGSITLNSAWTKYEFTTVFPTTAGLNPSAGQDDALYLQVQMPLDINCSINFTKPSIYLTNESPTNSFETYDEVDAIINSPRTGDIRISINSFNPYGWVAMNNGSIGNGASSATARANADTFQLYNLFWNAFNQYSTGTSSSGSNAVCPMFLGSTSVGYGPAISTSAITDFNANKAIVLTESLGRVIQGTVPVSSLLPSESQPITASNSGGNLLITGTIPNFQTFTGESVQFSNTGGALPTGLASTGIYYAIPQSANTFLLATTYLNALAGTVIAFGGAGSGTNTASFIPLGSVIGEYAHAQLLNELFNHTHDPLTPGTNFWESVVSASPGFLITAGGSSNAINSSTTGNVTGEGTQQPFNVTQPSVFLNMFVKL